MIQIYNKNHDLNHWI